MPEFCGHDRHEKPLRPGVLAFPVMAEQAAGWRLLGVRAGGGDLWIGRRRRPRLWHISVRQTGALI